jgi:hypothetical protein
MALRRVRDAVCKYIILLSLLHVLDALCEQCQELTDQVEETSLLQVHVQSSARSKVSMLKPPWPVDAIKKQQEAEMKWYRQKQKMAVAKMKIYEQVKKEEYKEKTAQWAMKKAEQWQELANSVKAEKHKGLGPVNPYSGDDRPRHSSSETEGNAPLLDAEVSADNPFAKASSSLSQECPAFAGQDACDEAIWLARMLERLTRGKSADLITEAARLLSLQSWFENPAGPSGFFNFLDSNHDGYLSADELGDYGGRGLLQVLDVDHTGHATRQECQSFLRGCALLFKQLPAGDASWSPKLAEVKAPDLLKLADTVAIANTVAVAPYANPFTEVASSLVKECPPPASKELCQQAISLAHMLEDLTAGADTPEDEVVAKASSALMLWYWFQTPTGPAGFFNIVDKEHTGAITSEDLLSIRGTSPDVVHVMNFIDEDHDGKASRANIQKYLRSCCILVHKLPVLDLASASTPLDYQFTIADSVVKMAVTGASPLAWTISMSCGATMLLCIGYVHCCASSRKAKKGQDLVQEDDEHDDEVNTARSFAGADEDGHLQPLSHSSSSSSISSAPGSSRNSARGEVEDSHISTPPRIGSTFGAGDCSDENIVVSTPAAPTVLNQSSGVSTDGPTLQR